MATLRIRLILYTAVIALATASCAGTPTVQPTLYEVPNPRLSDSLRSEALGVPLFAFSQGPEDADILLLGIHGWGASGAEGLVIGAALQRAAALCAEGADGLEDGGGRVLPTVRLVSPDLPGSGLSGKPSAPYTPEWFAQVLDAFRESLGRDRIVLVGHSLGGRLAMEYALRYPEHTRALILIAPAGLSESFRPLDRWAMSRPGIVRAGSKLVTERSYLRFYRTRAVHDPHYVYPEIARWAMDGLFTPDGRLAIQAVTRGALAAPDLTDRLKDIEVPVFLIWGKEDKVLRFRTSETYRVELPDLRGFLALDDCSHLPQTEHSEETARAVYSFLASLPPETR